MNKNVLMPIALFDSIVEMLEFLDTTDYAVALRYEFGDILGELYKKRKKQDLRAAYAKYINTADSNDRDLARIEYLRQRNELDRSLKGSSCF